MLGLWQNSLATQVSTSLSGNIINFFDGINSKILQFVYMHFNQAKNIESLTKQNMQLEHSATLLSTFASELNQILSDKQTSKYEPNVALVKTLGYPNIGDHSKIWLDDFNDFNTSKIYGLIWQGKTAGIAISKDNKPLALLQNDPKSSFSVYIGKDRIPGVASGNKSSVLVKFIPKWLEPKEGDEVYTSGLDGIFFGGVPVGKILKIKDENDYKLATLQLYNELSAPAYLYVVTKEK